jgi:hypothetical protein
MNLRHKKQESLILLAFLPFSIKRETGFEPNACPKNHAKKGVLSTSDLYAHKCAHNYSGINLSPSFSLLLRHFS